MKIFGKRQFSFDKNPLLVLLIVTVIAHVVSVCLLGFKAVEYPDSEGYLNLARRLQNMNFYGYEFNRTPGYSLIILLLGMHLKWVILFQYFLGFFSSYLLFKITRTILENDRLSVCTALIPCFIINYYFYERAILTETVSLFLFVLVVYLFCLKKDTVRNHLLLGVVCAFLMMTRTLFLYLAPLVTLIYIYEKRKESIVFLLKRIVIIISPTVFCFLLWSGMNKSHTGNFGLTTFFGINLAQTSVSFFDTYEGEHSKIKDIYVKHILESEIEINKNKKNAIWYAYEELLLETGYSQPELSNVLGEMSKELIVNNYDKYFQQVVVSFKDFWTNAFYWIEDSGNIYVANSFVAWRRASIAAQVLMNLIFMISFVYYGFRFFFYKSSKNRLVVFILLSVMSASVLQALIVYGDNARFLFPFSSMISLISVYFVNENYTKILAIKLKKQK
tara:strand:- start:8822 stop:10159 length:1338 start_codon:yes stop_codon:yes gene_type:complete